MLGNPDGIDRSLGELFSRLDTALNATGWQSLPRSSPSSGRFFRPTSGGVLAGAQVHRTSLGWPDDFPQDVSVQLGVGYGPALDLMPLLTLQAWPILVAPPDSAGPLRFVLADESAAAETAAAIAAFLDDRAIPFAARFAGPADIAAALGDDPAPALSGAAADLPEPAAEALRQDRGGHTTEVRLALLAATGRHEEARALLAHYLAAHGSDAGPAADAARRFARQLTRWLDAGGPPPPPVAETLALLPAMHLPSRQDRADADHDSTARREALDAARARNRDQPPTELAALIRAEQAARGLSVSRLDVALGTEMLLLERRPLGRARSTARLLRMATSAGVGVVQQIRGRAEPLTSRRAAGGTAGRPAPPGGRRAAVRAPHRAAAAAATGAPGVPPRRRSPRQLPRASPSTRGGRPAGGTAAQRPPRDEYALTEAGQAIGPVPRSLRERYATPPR